MLPCPKLQTLASWYSNYISLHSLSIYKMVVFYAILSFKNIKCHRLHIGNFFQALVAHNILLLSNSMSDII